MKKSTIWMMMFVIAFTFIGVVYTSVKVSEDLRRQLAVMTEERNNEYWRAQNAIDHLAFERSKRGCK